MLIKNLFETYVWKCTPGEIISKQCRHNDVTNKVEIYVSSKLDILYTVRNEISCWLKISLKPKSEKLLRKKLEN